MTANAPDADPELLTTAVDIARSGGDVTLQWFRRTDLEVETKADGSPVTAADKAAERHIRERIEQLYPGSAVIGEEEGPTSSGDQAAAALVWHVDPIDGTKAFARGVPLYSVLVAVSDDHGPAVGVIHIPATGETVWAGRGLGCHTDHGRASVSATDATARTFVTTSSVSRWGREVYSRIDDAGVDVRGWGDGYGFLMVATGRVDGMIDLGGGNPWDYAPMPVILQEAGGRFSDLAGASNIESPSVVASNGVLHEELLKLING